MGLTIFPSASKYYTPDIEKACLKIAPIDLLSQPEESQKLGPILHSLKHWNNGKNFIFFNFNNLDTGKYIGNVRYISRFK